MRGLIVAACLLGCGEDFASRSLVEDYRLIGIQADAPEIPSDGQVVLRAFDLIPTEAPVTYDWSVCLWSFGVAAHYACIEPAFEHPLDGDGSATLDLGPDGLDFAAFHAIHGPIVDGRGAPLELTDGLDVWVRLRATPEDGRAVEAVKRIRVRDGGTPNTNPIIDALQVERIDPDTVEVRVHLASGAAETYVDPLDGVEKVESLLFTWYTTAGELDPPLTFDATRETRLRLPMSAAPPRIAVAVRDGRGGLAVAQTR